ncbi:conserved hypothetical protein [Neospora caninum Liverpool]|uniref:Uncharacterized protein n=1 Tax=Neospora caninum (strain Liverpool) TaxID=572307 RepID=F0VEU4_NEOCL|nr:conserved hypothetical protein [Neospora caninum Liverpool]CBZ52238.1 conserved hypothetical protein [Neospora caninum Liverpool]CEL66206.1 TPA: hypothetical protein BN1204_020240 [Neospora caninum Liverpool]|eukprot:XP_003882270.1 conserved hypothetical protein [Neospora caninum Liverpool]
MGQASAVVTAVVGLLCAAAMVQEFPATHAPNCDVPSPEGFEPGCEPGNACVQPCYRVSCQLKGLRFITRDCRQQTVNVWIEVLSVKRSPTVCDGELLEVFPPEKQFSGSFSITPIANHGRDVPCGNLPGESCG